MVSYTEVLASNQLLNDSTAPSVCVFVGATSGIGRGTARALIATGAATRIYLVGRESARAGVEAFTREANETNPKAEIIFIQGETSLLAETKRVCDIIKGKESHIDLLFLSAGYAPLGERIETAEGIEICQSLEYYARTLFTTQLLPLLRKAPAPRVVTVGSGGMETTRAINADDFDLKQPGNFSDMTAQLQYGCMNSVTFDALAQRNPDVTFIHTMAGMVNTGNARRSGRSNSAIAWLIWLFIEPITRLFGTTEDHSGQRHLFISTSAAFGGRGVPWSGRQGVNSSLNASSGVFLVSLWCNCTPNENFMRTMREKVQERLWNHTKEVLEPYE